MEVPKISPYLTEADWKKNVLPAIKRKWKSSKGMTLVSTCLRSLKGNLDLAIKNCGPAGAKKLDVACKTLVVNIKKLQALLKAEKNPDDKVIANAIHAHTEKMIKAVAVLKKVWNDKFVSAWKVGNINSFPGLKKSFYTFSKKRFCEENIEFLTVAVKTPADPKKLYQLYELFVKSGAKKEINIKSGIRAKWAGLHVTIDAFVNKKKIKGVGVDKLQAKDSVKDIMKLKGVSCKEINGLGGDTMRMFRNTCRI